VFNALCHRYEKTPSELIVAHAKYCASRPGHNADDRKGSAED